MSVKLNIEYEQLLELAKQLSSEEKEQFILDLREKPTNFQEFLLEFNTMTATEEELQGYKDAEKSINKMFKR